MPGSTRVTRLRISHLGTCIHDKLRTIGEPVAFATRLSTLEPVAGLPVTMPYGKEFPVDTTFWSRLADGRRLTVPVTGADAPKLRVAGVPLRCTGDLTAAAATVPRFEAHLHPFGVVAMTTVDLIWPSPVPLDDILLPVRELDGQPATITAGALRWTTTLGGAAAAAAEGIVGLLTAPGTGAMTTLPTHRLVTVISGVTDQPASAMPAAGSPLHLAMHQLSAGHNVIAEPATAFVPLWSNAGYILSPARMLYMLDRGSTLLSADFAATTPVGREPTTSDLHRWLLLLLAHLMAVTGLVRAARGSTSVLFPKWAATAALQIGRLFGPGGKYLDWGLVTRALLRRLGASDDVNAFLPAPLRENPDFPMPHYVVPGPG